MTDVMVSVRMPASLTLALKELKKKKSFLDLSEEVRSLIREKWMQHTRPELYELKKLREDIKKELRKKSSVEIQKQVIKELDKIKSQLKEEVVLK